MKFLSLAVVQAEARLAKEITRALIGAAPRDKIRIPKHVTQLQALFLIQIVQEALPEISGVAALLETAQAVSNGDNRHVITI
jgi:hypothetical protein